MNIKSYSKIVIVSDTDSYYASMCSKKIFSVLCSLPVEVHLDCEYIVENKLIDSSTLFIAISTSGESEYLNGCINYARHNKSKIIGITSSAYSYLARLCDYTILNPPIYSENNIALSEFIICYLSLCFLSIHLGSLMGTVSDVYMDVAIKMASMLPSKIAQSTRQNAYNEKYAYLLNNSQNIIFTGCGIDSYLAQEISNFYSKISIKSNRSLPSFMLKNMEIPVDTTIIGIISNKDYLHQFKQNLTTTKNKGAKTIIITNCNIDNSLSQFDDVMTVQDTLPIFNIITSISYLYSLTINAQKYNQIKLESEAI